MLRFFGSTRGRWCVLGAFGVLTLVLGIGGFQEQAHAQHTGLPFLDGCYNTLQLTTLGYQGSGPLNWRLEVARFVAPLLLAGTVVQSATVVFHDQFERFRLRFARGHTIVCGLGSAGSRVAVALGRAGQRVVAIEADSGAAGVVTARDHGVTVLVGDATDPVVLHAARIDRAARLVVMCGPDATNVEVVAIVRRIPRSSSLPALRCSVHVTDADLCALLRGEELGNKGAVRIGFFNLHERAARAWVSEHPPFEGSDHPHPVVLGVGQVGGNLIVALAQRWIELGGGTPLTITIVDRAAQGRWEALRMQHPALPDVCTPTILDLDFGAPTTDAVDSFRSILAGGGPTWVAVAFDNESLALSSALFVRQTLHSVKVPVVVRAKAQAGLGGLLIPLDHEAEPPFPNMAVFPFLDRTCTADVVEAGVRDQIARAIHEDYLARAGVGDGLRRPWEDLDDAERDSSRRAADGIVDGLASIGCDLMPMGHWGAPDTTLEPDEVEQLAKREHDRWRAERGEAGWTYGPTRDDERKHNPLLVDWNELADETREQNREATRALPAMLARAGFEPIRR